MAIGDILGAGSEEARAVLASDYRRAITERRYGAIVLDDLEGSMFLPDIEKHYDRQQLELGGPDVLWPVTGYQTRPEFIFVPRANAAGL
jgi:hypothetical protein